MVVVAFDIVDALQRGIGEIVYRTHDAQPDGVGVAAVLDEPGLVRMEDVASLPKITERLVKAGYKEDQLSNFWSGNALRVLGLAQAARKN